MQKKISYQSKDDFLLNKVFLSFWTLHLYKTWTERSLEKVSWTKIARLLNNLFGTCRSLRNAWSMNSFDGPNLIVTLPN